jgi:hypothetical protein
VIAASRPCGKFDVQGIASLDGYIEDEEARSAGAHSLGEAYGRPGGVADRPRRQGRRPAWEVHWWIRASREPDYSAWPAPISRAPPLAVNP